MTKLLDLWRYGRATRRWHLVVLSVLLLLVVRPPRAR